MNSGFQILMRGVLEGGWGGLYCIFVTEFLKSFEGYMRWVEKLPGGSPYSGFYCIFINKCFEICLGGPIFNLSPLTPPCVYLWVLFMSSGTIYWYFSHLMIPSLSDWLLHQGQIVEPVVDADPVLVDDQEAGRDASAVTLPTKKFLIRFCKNQTY
jgi:hypothetical protein